MNRHTYSEGDMVMYKDGRDDDRNWIWSVGTIIKCIDIEDEEWEDFTEYSLWEEGNRAKTRRYVSALRPFDVDTVVNDLVKL